MTIRSRARCSPRAVAESAQSVEDVVHGVAQAGAGPPRHRHGRRGRQPGEGADRDAAIHEVGDRLRGQQAQGYEEDEIEGTLRPIGPGRRGQGGDGQPDDPERAADRLAGIRLVDQGRSDRPDGAEQSEREGDRRQLDQPGRQAQAAIDEQPLGGNPERRDRRPAVCPDHHEEPGQGHGHRDHQGQQGVDPSRSVAPGEPPSPRTCPGGDRRGRSTKVILVEQDDRDGDQCQPSHDQQGQAHRQAADRRQCRRAGPRPRAHRFGGHPLMPAIGQQHRQHPA